MQILSKIRFNQIKKFLILFVLFTYWSVFPLIIVYTRRFEKWHSFIIIYCNI